MRKNIFLVIVLLCLPLGGRGMGGLTPPRGTGGSGKGADQSHLSPLKIVNSKFVNRKSPSPLNSTPPSGGQGAYFTPDVDGLNVMESGGEAYISTSGNVPYVECSWTGGDTDGHVVKTTKFATGVSNYNGETEIFGGWYLLLGNPMTYEDRLIISGDVKFILQDGCNVEFKKGIRSGAGSTLTIYGQSGGTGTLRATGSGSYKSAAIGADENTEGGSLVIHGGTITATSSKSSAAGIGSGKADDKGMQSITIWDGNITATSTTYAAGIGGGEANRGPSVTIYGGTVTASCSEGYGAGIGGGRNRGNNTIKIYGGNITANGHSGGAGIGGGPGGDLDNPVYIYGGTVTANGGLNGAGIGGGGYEYGGGSQKNSIYIGGGTVTAKGGANSAGIGGGNQGHGGVVTIDGGTVYAYGGKDGGRSQQIGAGIGGGGNGNGGTVTINGGYVEAWGGHTVQETGSTDVYSASAGIGGGSGCNGGTVIINGGKVKAGSGIQFAVPIGHGGVGGGTRGNDGTLTIASNLMVTSNITGKAATADRVTVCQTENNSTKPYVIIEPCNHNGTTYTIKDADYHTIGNCSYCGMSGSDEAHAFGDYSECGNCGLVSLADDSDNSSTISHWAGETKSVALTGRKLYKDGNWNTLSLPFSVALSGDLANATVMEIDVDNKWSIVNGQWSISDSGQKTGYDGRTLYLNFKDGPTTLLAGQPYIVKWDDSNSYVESPIFTNATFEAGNPSSITSNDGKVSFLGIYSPKAIGEDGGKSVLYLGSGNQLYYPSENTTPSTGGGAMTINAFRAYFQLIGITAGDLPTGNIRMLFGEEEETGISLTPGPSPIGEGSIYTLDGRKVANGQWSIVNRQLKKGLYITNGRKVTIK